MNYLTHQLNIKCLRTISLWILYLQQLTVFWNVVPCSLIVVHWSHGGMCCHHCQGVWVYFFEPSGCGSRFVWNSVELVPEYMTSHLKKYSNPCNHYHENLASDLNYISDFGTDIASSHVICPEIVTWKCVAIAASKNTNIIAQPSFIT
jgi:hypothetical protein